MSYQSVHFAWISFILLIHESTAFLWPHEILDQIKILYTEGVNWSQIIPLEWIDRALSIPGSGYVIAFVYWLRHPLLLCFLLPMLTLVFIYFTVLLIHLCRLRYWLLHQWIRWFPSSVRHHHITRHDLVSLAQLLKRLMAAVWDAHGRIFHAYEVIGMEKLPHSGPAFIVYYHGTCPFDAYYFLSRHLIERDRFPIPVVDRFLFRIPGLRIILDLLGAIEGTVETCASYLNPNLQLKRPSVSELGESNASGCVLLLSPGGVREALFADEFYSLAWGNRHGFAKVALLAKQPIYPMFTENIREVIRVVHFGKSWWEKLYERTRLPFALFYGYFPVKLRTYIGDPIYPQEGESAEHLARRTHQAITEMIRTHQWTPSNLLCAILQRIPTFDRWFEKCKQRKCALTS